MQDFAAGVRGGRYTSVIAVVLAATLVAMAAALFLVKPSEAHAAEVTVDPLTVGFGADQVDGTATTPRTIVFTNTGTTAVTIGGTSTTITGTDALDFNLLGQVIDTTTGLPLIDAVTGLPVDLNTGITVGAGETVELQSTFNASAEGTRDAVLRLTDTAGNLLQNVNLTGTGTQTDPFAQPGAQGCDIVGTPANDVLTGTPAQDVICGLGGADRINGRGANDVLRGGAGNDRITDKSGKDKLLGQGGRDTLNAKDGNRGDLLKGGGGKDRAFKDGGDRARSI